MLIDESHHLEVCGNRGLREVVEKSQNLFAAREVTQSNFSRHPRVAQHCAVPQEGDELRISAAEMVDPDRRVN